VTRAASESVRLRVTRAQGNKRDRAAGYYVVNARTRLAVAGPFDDEREARRAQQECETAELGTGWSAIEAIR
jgi:hypothetical protein